jgi:hypothetical protein
VFFSLVRWKYVLFRAFVMFRIIILAFLSVRWDLLICKLCLLFRIRGYDDCLRCRKELISFFFKILCLMIKSTKPRHFCALCTLFSSLTTRTNCCSNFSAHKNLVTLFLFCCDNMIIIYVETFVSVFLFSFS